MAPGRHPRARHTTQLISLDHLVCRAYGAQTWVCEAASTFTSRHQDHHQAIVERVGSAPGKVSFFSHALDSGRMNLAGLESLSHGTIIGFFACCQPSDSQSAAPTLATDRNISSACLRRSFHPCCQSTPISRMVQSYSSHDWIAQHGLQQAPAPVTHNSLGIGARVNGDLRRHII